MNLARRLTNLAALAALLVGAVPSASFAASCETALKPYYSCTATFDSGDTATYCLTGYTDLPGDGQFALYEGGGSSFYCTCEAKGKAPGVRFGTSSRDFFCASDSIAVAGKMSPTRITAQGYSVDLYPGLRSSFTCQAVAACP
jgi:hypothetical protein